MSVCSSKHSLAVSSFLCFIDLVRGMLRGPVIDSQLAPLGSAESSFLSACRTLMLSTYCLFRGPFPSSAVTPTQLTASFHCFLTQCFQHVRVSVLNMSVLLYLAVTEVLKKQQAQLNTTFCSKHSQTYTVSLKIQDIHH